ncbi:hypothetical protein [Deinococcus soli (ex Cha et al. 2016)]|uniref:Membrane protein YqiK n=2 Tax=Deinococcus soli (ex Cha et al. 2016) TaxID=1309411 RepID=A0ACC6KEI3_9DEIO|nr:hypothetical protein [Deinococcus soli (ex Cha et al. 2016)]MDR6217841.1 putative membrane protein YqiK [Deinococcus soli (ex Cha et al. 2016)]MDR6328091.1 putative membrane protein YqiK [Deinococcus soli (ex Cha et al. 2016)]MDR6750943.1 putative membrane protein YqiK [Deinococcus soli (ex Cha et al. 2016)]
MPDLSVVLPFLIGVVIVLIALMILVALVRAFYVKVEQGTALIVNDLSARPKVRFTGALVVPVLYKAEIMRISLITLQVDRRGKEGLICKDNIRADITVAYYLRVNETTEDVLKVAKSIGASRASDLNAVDELFNAKFSEALKTVGKKFDFIELFEKREEFRDAVVAVIGRDLNGYVLEDVAIDYLEQTPKSMLDQNNIMDAEGIRKITQLTAAQNIVTNELSQNEHLAVTKKNVETREATLALERQQAEAEARQKREIETIQARENAETQRVREEQRLISEQARIQTTEQVEIREQERQRQVEIAEQARLRAIAIEAERVARAAKMEAVTTDREVKLQEIERDKNVEQGVMDVANITRERISIDKTVAVEEERINEVREVSAADRAKQVRVMQAEAQAQEQLVQEVKAAEAAETAARHRAAELTTIAQAEFDAASRQAEAKKILADAVKVEQAAPGLAQVMVQEANASALEKTGVAEARVIEVKADANLKLGQNEARVLAERLGAQAEGETRLGQAKATATEALGAAEASATRDRMNAEAEGLTAKFGAMDRMSADARSHEEYRMALETSLQQALASIEAGKEISRENAEVIAAALKNAKIDLVGGEGGMFEALTRALSLGKAVEGFTQKSPLFQSVLGRFGVNVQRENRPN